MSDYKIVGYEYQSRHVDGRTVIGGPFLIKELYDLVPYMSGKYIDFQLMSNPRTKIGTVSIMGLVMNIVEDNKYIEITIDDGTGKIKVLVAKDIYLKYRSPRIEIDKKYENLAKEGDISSLKYQEEFKKVPIAERHRFAYSQSMSERHIVLLEKYWWSETQEGLLGKEIKPNDYVQAMGYFSARAKGRESLPVNYTKEDIQMTEVFLFGRNVTCISELTYCTTLDKWMDIFGKRHESLVK